MPPFGSCSVVYPCVCGQWPCRENALNKDIYSVASVGSPYLWSFAILFVILKLVNACVSEWRTEWGSECVSEWFKKERRVSERISFVFDRKRLYFRQSTNMKTLVMFYFASISECIRKECLAIMTWRIGKKCKCSIILVLYSDVGRRLNILLFDVDRSVYHHTIQTN
jgi:hypothetical protein